MSSSKSPSPVHRGARTERTGGSQTRSGLPLRGERHITIMSSSPIGTVTYHEDGSWQMTYLQPRT